jgi:hypothetical protein
MNRVQPVISNHISRYSYGILCNEIYNRKKHIGGGRKHPINGKTYAIDQINWFIFKGDNMSGQQEHFFHRVVESTNQRMTWVDKIVATERDGALPRSLEADTRVVYEIRSAMEMDPQMKGKKKVRKGTNGIKYWEIDHRIIASFESVQVKFEIRGEDDQKVNEDNGIVVDSGDIPVREDRQGWQQMPVKIREKRRGIWKFLVWI